jgi:fatty-acyl-CoA synthase
VSLRPVIRDRSDIERFEARRYEDAVPVSGPLAIIERAARLWPERVALTYLAAGDLASPASEISYRELLARTLQAANLFRRLGVGEGDAVGLLLPNIPGAHYALWGAEIAGRACPINFMLQPAHIAELLRAARAKVLVALGPNRDLAIWDKIEAVRRAAPELNAVLHLDSDEPPSGGALGFEAACAGEPDRLTFERRPKRDDIAAYFHTGGTTGAPKLAQHTHGNQAHTSWTAGLFYDLGPDDTLINGFPLFHVAGTFVFGLAAFAAGSRIILPTRLGMRHPEFVRNYWRFVERQRVTMLAAVPTVMATLISLDPAGADLSSVRALLTGGSPLPNELAAAFEQRYGKPVRNILGMTESAGLVAIEPLQAPRVPGSVGLPLPFTEVRAMRLGAGGVKLDELCAPGETGVVALRGPHVGPGYTDPARNAGMFEQGWLVSGDLGHVDANGRVYITGRAKDLIIRGGHNIDPAMIEEAALRHPAVEVAAAVGAPDAYAGELPVLFVTLKPGATAAESEILAHLERNIAERPALPKRVTILDAVPVTPVGKIYKPALRLRAIETALGAQLAPAATGGTTIRVEAVEDGAKIAAIVHVAPGADCKGVEAEIAGLLRDYAIEWRIAWH